MNKKHDIYVASIQTVEGTAEAGLGSGHFIEVLPDSKLDMTFENDENETVSGTFGSDPSIQGAARVDCQLDFNLRSFGSGVADWATISQGAGFALSTDIVGESNEYTLKQSMKSKDVTVWKHNGTEVKKAHNLIFDWKIAGEINKKCTLSLIGKGCLTALPGAGVSPTVTKSGHLTPAILPVTKVIFGSAVYSPLKFEFSGNNVVEQRVSGSDFGYGKSEMTDRKIKFSCQVYSEVTSVIDPYAAMRTGTSTELSFEFGPTGKKIKLITEHANILDIKESTSGNLIVWDISGDCNDDDFSIIVNSDLAE